MGLSPNLIARLIKDDSFHPPSPDEGGVHHGVYHRKAVKVTLTGAFRNKSCYFSQIAQSYLSRRKYDRSDLIAHDTLDLKRITLQSVIVSSKCRVTM